MTASRRSPLPPTYFGTEPQLNGHGSGKMKSTRPADPRFMQLPRGTSMTTSIVAGSADASACTCRPSLASIMARAYASRNGVAKHSGWATRHQRRHWAQRQLALPETETPARGRGHLNHHHMKGPLSYSDSISRIRCPNARNAASSQPRSRDGSSRDSGSLDNDLTRRATRWSAIVSQFMESSSSRGCRRRSVRASLTDSSGCCRLGIGSDSCVPNDKIAIVAARDCERCRRVSLPPQEHATRAASRAARQSAEVASSQAPVTSRMPMQLRIVRIDA